MGFSRYRFLLIENTFCFVLIFSSNFVTWATYSKASGLNDLKSNFSFCTFSLYMWFIGCKEIGEATKLSIVSACGQIVCQHRLVGLFLGVCMCLQFVLLNLFVLGISPIRSVRKARTRLSKPRENHRWVAWSVST